LLSARYQANVPLVVMALLAACASPAPRGTESGAARSTRVDETTRIAQLERAARALAKNGGCESASSCRSAPVGSRACGGPRAYVVYCPATTDTVALLRALDELRRAEMDFNERSGAISTCEMRLPPKMTLQGGQCAAAR
jgi:hypothetical protein